MADRQHEVLRKRVVKAEGDLPPMVPAIEGILREIPQHIVHPAHVPLKPEAQPTIGNGTGHARKGRAFLRHGEGGGGLLLHRAVDRTQQVDRLIILAPAIAVGHPLPLRPGIVAVEHGGHGIHAQPIHMVFLHPIAGIGGQEVLHLRPAVIVDQRVPVLMEALARVRVLIKGGAVKPAQPVGIGRKMRRHPIEDHPQPRRMGGIDQIAELMRGAVAHGWRIKAHRLIAPGAVKRMLRDWQQFDMGKAHVAHIGDKFTGGFLVGDRAIALAIVPPPGAQMHLINGDRRLHAMPRRAALHPVAIGPAIARDIAHDAGGVRAMLRPETNGIGLQRQQRPIRIDDFILIGHAFADIGQENLPYAGGTTGAHHIAPPVPIIERTHYGDAPRIGGPNSEMGAHHAFMLHHMGAEDVPKPAMGALVEQVFVQFAQNGAKAVGIAVADRIPALCALLQHIPGSLWQLRVEDIRRPVDTCHAGTAILCERGDCGGIRGVDGQIPVGVPVARAKDGEQVCGLAALDRGVLSAGGCVC